MNFWSKNETKLICISSTDVYHCIWQLLLWKSWRQFDGFFQWICITFLSRVIQILHVQKIILGRVRGQKYRDFVHIFVITYLLHIQVNPMQNVFRILSICISWLYIYKHIVNRLQLLLKEVEFACSKWQKRTIIRSNFIINE
jgi:phosphatidylserine synthase